MPDQNLNNCILKKQLEISQRKRNKYKSFAQFMLCGIFFISSTWGVLYAISIIFTGGVSIAVGIAFTLIYGYLAYANFIHAKSSILVKYKNNKDLLKKAQQELQDLTNAKEAQDIENAKKHLKTADNDRDLNSGNENSQAAADNDRDLNSGNENSQAAADNDRDLNSGNENSQAAADNDRDLNSGNENSQAAADNDRDLNSGNENSQAAADNDRDLNSGNENSQAAADNDKALKLDKEKHQQDGSLDTKKNPQKVESTRNNHRKSKYPRTRSPSLVTRNPPTQFPKHRKTLKKSNKPKHLLKGKERGSSSYQEKLLQDAENTDSKDTNGYQSLKM